MNKKAVTIEQPVSLRKANFHGPCEVGCYTYFNGSAEVFNAKIGRYCSIASGVVIGPGEHPTDRLSTHPFAFGGGANRFHKDSNYEQIVSKRDRNKPYKTTLIGHDVWIGNNCQIMQGVSLGNGSIIAAGAVVTKDVAPFTIVGGVPAKVIKNRFSESTIDRLARLEWWNYSLKTDDVGSLRYGDFEKTLEALEALKSSDKLLRLAPKTKQVSRRWHQRFFTKT